MKRSEKLSREARHHLLVFLTLLSALVALGVWTATVWESSVSGGVLMLLSTVAVFALAFREAAEAARLFRMADEETHWDTIRSIRPRL